jgi:hemolysin activation/secretion protein
LGLGVDMKSFEEDVSVGGIEKSTPIEYFPITLNYNATWQPKAKDSRPRTTELNLAATWHTRGLGSDIREFDSKRYKATGSFLTVKGDVAHTRELAGGWEAYLKIHGQWSGTPLINNEQYAGGGLTAGRGYLESTTLGDQAVLATAELRTPSVLGSRFFPYGKSAAADEEVPAAQRPEWRFHAFCDAGYLRLLEPLPEQDDTAQLLSVGLGSRFQFGRHYSGSIDAGYPLQAAGRVDQGDILVTFKLGADF